MKNKLEFLTDQMGHRWEKYDAETLTHYTWDKYGTTQTLAYYWNKYNTKPTSMYYWNTHEVKEDISYSWHQYERIDTQIRTDYYWNKYVVGLVDRYPSWIKQTIDQDQIYVWDKYEAVIDEEASARTLGYIHVPKGASGLGSRADYGMVRYYDYQQNRVIYNFNSTGSYYKCYIDPWYLYASKRTKTSGKLYIYADVKGPLSDWKANSIDVVDIVSSPSQSTVNTLKTKIDNVLESHNYVILWLESLNGYSRIYQNGYLSINDTTTQARFFRIYKNANYTIKLADSLYDTSKKCLAIYGTGCEAIDTNNNLEVPETKGVLLYSLFDYVDGYTLENVLKPWDKGIPPGQATYSSLKYALPVYWGEGYEQQYQTTYILPGSFIMAEDKTIQRFSIEDTTERPDYFFSWSYGYTPGGTTSLNISMLPETATIINQYYAKDDDYVYMPTTSYTTDKIYKAGDFIEEVKNKTRNTYPDNGKVDNYWYTYNRQQSVQPFLISCLYSTEVDLEGWLPCENEPLFNTDTGVITYTVSQSGDYYINPDNETVYITVLENGYLFWSSIENDGQQLYDYGAYIEDYPMDSRYYQQYDTVLAQDHYKGDFLEQVIATEDDVYPEDAEYEGYWYTYDKTVPIIETSKGAYITDVSYLNEMKYPVDGPEGQYWYTYITNRIVRSPGRNLGLVNSQYSNTYPANGIQNNIWYIYEGVRTTYTKGDFIEKTKSYNSSAYPQNGLQDYYWYEYSDMNTETLKTDFIETMNSTDPKQYPEDGVVGQFWYVYNHSYQSTDPTLYLEEVWSDQSDTYPEDGVEEEYYYKYLGKKYIPQYIIGDSLLKGHVKYSQDINTEEDYVPGDVACAEIQFSIYDDLRDAEKYLDLECDYYKRMTDQEPWELVGHFTVQTADEQTNTTTKLKAYDNIIKTDIIVDDFINGYVYPKAMSVYFTDLLTYCGLSSSVRNTQNSTFSIQDNFQSTNLTGRQILSLIAEVASGYVKADKDGTIVLCSYKPTQLSLDKTNYKSLKKAIYETEKIDKVNIAMSEDDVGVSTGTGDILYRIIDNPLVYADAPADLETAINNIYNTVKQVQYVPMEITAYSTFGIETGDIITVDGDTCYVQSIDWDGSTVKIKSKGKRYRTIEKNQIDGSLDKLRGKSNELTRSIEQTNSRITDVQAGLQSQITQTANSITTYIDDQISDTKTEIKQTTDSISSTVSSQGNDITSIKQDLSGIQLSYNSTNGTASIKIGDITVSNLTNTEYVQRQVAGIDLTGYVRFNDLSNSGSTTINGSNITTGTISADRLNLTGSIAWGDLTQSCKNTIASYAGQDGSDASVPDYIHDTYIDSTTIISPTISGGTITAGTTAEGYVKMTSSGLNFMSKNNTPLIGLGVHEANYLYPYIVFGQGVDFVGTDRGMVKKFADGIWIGNTACQNGTTPYGKGLFINFDDNHIYAYIGNQKTTIV